MFKVSQTNIRPMYCKRIRNPESSKFLLLESGIHNGLESGIHFGMESGIQRVEIQNPDAGIRNLEAGIQNPGPSWILLHGAKIYTVQISCHCQMNMKGQLCAVYMYCI